MRGRIYGRANPNWTKDNAEDYACLPCTQHRRLCFKQRDGVICLLPLAKEFSTASKEGQIDAYQIAEDQFDQLFDRSLFTKTAQWKHNENGKQFAAGDTQEDRSRRRQRAWSQDDNAVIAGAQSRPLSIADSDDEDVDQLNEPERD